MAVLDGRTNMKQRQAVTRNSGCIHVSRCLKRLTPFTTPQCNRSPLPLFLFTERQSSLPFPSNPIVTSCHRHSQAQSKRFMPQLHLFSKGIPRDMLADILVPQMITHPNPAHPLLFTKRAQTRRTPALQNTINVLFLWSPTYVHGGGG